MKTAIILAAGQSKRLRPYTDNMPKTLLEVGDKTILEHQLNALKLYGISDIHMVLGYKAEMIKNFAGPEIKYHFNKDFDKTNVLASLSCAKDHLSDGFYFLHADTLFDPSILKDLIESSHDITLPIQVKKLGEEEMKVKIVDNKIKLINKTMDPLNAHGEFIGIAKLSAEIVPKLISKMDQILRANAEKAFFEEALQKLIDEENVEVHPLDIGDRFSIEIDFPEDLMSARDYFKNK